MSAMLQRPRCAHAASISSILRAIDEFGAGVLIRRIGAA
jgi:hypothetical protein